MSQISQQLSLYDWSGKTASSASAPVTNRVGSALTSPQGGIVQLGSDYASTPSAQVQKVDSAGQTYQVPGTATGAPLATVVNTVIGSQTFAGSISLAYDPTNNRYTPFQVDATGAGVVRNALASTIAYSPATQINTGATAGKSMLSVFNASTTLYQRILGFYAMCPPQAGLNGGLLSSSTYTTVGMGVYRFTTAHTGGTVVAGALHDTRDTYDSSFTCRTGATITGQASAALYVFDAAYSSINGYGHREDPGVKVWTMAPGEGINFQCLSAVGGSGVNFYMRVVTAQNTA